MNSAEKLRLLRQRMQEQGMDAYVVVTDDFHGSEYVGDYFKAREYLSGFTGSAGTLVVLPDSAALWTDGRYFLQAADQLAGSTIDLMRAGQPGVPTIGAFLAQKVPQGGIVGFDGRTVSSLFARTMAAALEGKNVRFAYEQDLAGAVWPDRPALSAQPVWELPAECAGLTREEKLRLLREKMRETGAEVLVLTALDEVAWTLNLRGDDVRCTPVFLSFLLLRQEEATLCVQEQILSGELKEKLAACGVALAPYESIYDRLRAIPAGTTVQTDSATANYCVLQSLSGAKVLDRPSPVQLMKAMKTPAEQENFRAAHIKDGVAVCRFICWLQSHVGKEPITECSAAAKLESFRAQQPDYLGPSFDSIMAFGPHGAIVHYEPTAETDVPLEPRSFCLADTGGHYLQGTTDITRTIPLGPLTEEERRVYTLVLRGHLQLGAAKFLHGCTGETLDMLARAPLWEAGLDYNHGTGHGVGFVLGVHEGPERIHWDVLRQKRHCVIEEGMIFSNEPGVYLAGKFGVRIENLVVVRAAEENEYGRFLTLEPLTLVPYDRDAIDLDLLSSRDLALLNSYHEKVFAALSPYLAGDELAWLRDATAPLGSI